VRAALGDATGPSYRNGRTTHGISHAPSTQVVWLQAGYTAAPIGSLDGRTRISTRSYRQTSCRTDWLRDWRGTKPANAVFV